jgi:Kef-type K+ transport system membrane component KefB
VTNTRVPSWPLRADVSRHLPIIWLSYLAFGILLHANPVHLTPSEFEWIHQLGDFGLLFLMYLSGLEVDVTLLRPRLWRGQRTNPLYLSVSIFCTTLLVSYALSVALTQLAFPGAHPWMLTLLFATTSMGIILPILEESGKLGELYGQTLLLCALLADVCTIFLLSLFVSMRSDSVRQFVGMKWKANRKCLCVGWRIARLDTGRA